MNNPNQGGAAGGDDYLDKAFNAGAKKFGGAQGQKIAANRGMSEKIVCTLTLPQLAISTAPVVLRGS